MTSEARGNVWALLAANHRGDTDGVVALLGGLNRGELIGVAISLATILDAVCTNTLWSELPDDQVDAMLRAVLEPK